MAKAPAAAVDIGTLIECLPGVYGGRPRLARSGLPVIQLAADYRSGMRLPDLREAYPFVDEESIYAGIAYYLANRDALDAELDEHDRDGAAAYAEWAKGSARASA